MASGTKEKHSSEAKTFHPWFRGLGDQPPPRQEARAGSGASGAQAGAWGEVPAMDTWPVGVHVRGRRSLDGSWAPAGSHTPDAGTQGAAPSLPKATQQSPTQRDWESNLSLAAGLGLCLPQALCTSNSGVPAPVWALGPHPTSMSSSPCSRVSDAITPGSPSSPALLASVFASCPRPSAQICTCCPFSFSFSLSVSRRLSSCLYSSVRFSLRFPHHLPTSLPRPPLLPLPDYPACLAEPTVLPSISISHPDPL